jgi:hypothetical protein
MHSVSFNSPQGAAPAFGANNRRHNPRPTHRFEIDDSATNSRREPESSAACRTVSTGVGLLGLTSVLGLLTSPLWAPMLGVGLACNRHAPEGAIAKIKPIAGLGPAEGLCPSAFVMPNGDIMINDAPSWDTFHKKGHADADGIVTHQNDVVGALMGDKFYQGDLVKGLFVTQTNAAQKPHSFPQIAAHAAPSKTVDDKGTVRKVGKWGVITMTHGKTHLIGEAKGKKLQDLPEDQQKMIKAAAAANSHLWSMT